MSSILIKGADMPKNCGICNAIYHGVICHVIFKSPDERPKGCPLVEVPTPHGRLIDAVKTFENVELAYRHVAGDEFDDETLNHVLAAIVVTPTVIEAEEQR